MLEHNDILKLGLLYNSKLAYLDFYIPNTNICYDKEYDKGIFIENDKRFVEAIYKREGLETEIIYEGKFNNILELKNKLNELGYLL